MVNKGFRFKVASMHGQNLPDSPCTVVINIVNDYEPENVTLSVEGLSGNESFPLENLKKGDNQISFDCVSGSGIEITISVNGDPLEVGSIIMATRPAG